MISLPLGPEPTGLNILSIPFGPKVVLTKSASEYAPKKEFNLASFPFYSIAPIFK